MLHTLTYILFISVIEIFRLLPRRVQIVGVTALIRFSLWLMPKYKKIAHQNLSLVFPSMALADRRAVLSRHCVELATLVVDFLDIESISKEWVDNHVELDASESDVELMRGGGGMIFVSAHFGTFELLPSVFRHSIQRRLNFVVRPLKQPKIDRWWNAKREYWGSRTVAREGAMRGLIKALRENECVGLLFDQNVREAHGVFVEWFGRLACTTRAVGMLAVKTRVPVFMANLTHKEDGTSGSRTLQFQFRRIELDHILQDDRMSDIQKELAVTQQCVRRMEQAIREHPASWFWLHRRWKTAPKGSPLERFYEAESLQGVEV